MVEAFSIGSYSSNLVYVNSNGVVDFLRNQASGSISGIYADATIGSNVTRFKLTFKKACKVYINNNQYTRGSVSPVNYSSGNVLDNIDGYESLLILPQ